MAVSYKICSSTLQLSSTWPSGASVPCRNSEPLMCCQQSSQCLHAPCHPPQPCLAVVPQKGHLIHCIQIHFQSWGEKHIENRTTEHPSERYVPHAQIQQQARGLNCCWLATGAPISQRHQQLPWQIFHLFSAKSTAAMLATSSSCFKHHPRFLLLSLCSFMGQLSISKLRVWDIDHSLLVSTLMLPHHSTYSSLCAG